VFVLLIAPSGVKKSYGIMLASKLMALVGNNRIISGRNTIQSIIKRLALSQTSQNGGPPLKEASGMLLSSELLDFLQDFDTAIPILTDLYDAHYHELWINSLKGAEKGTMEVETLSRPTLTMLAASNEANFKAAMPQHASAGGFLGRCMVIIEQTRSRKNPLTEPPEKELDLNRLAEYLRSLSRVTGEFIWEPAAKQLFNEWYDVYDSTKADDPTGGAERMDEQVLRVAMLTSLSRKQELLLLPEDIQEGLRACSTFTRNVRQLVAGKGRNPLGEQTAIVLNELLKSPGFRTDRKYLLKKWYGEFNAAELDQIVMTLKGGGFINVSTDGEILALDQRVIDEYVKKEQRKQ
jgi:hypothetical protein